MTRRSMHQQRRAGDAATKLTAAQADRACGVLLGAACGDALGAGYEFGVAALPPAGQRPAMIGGGLGDFAPGEWTDDTSLTYAIAEVAATGADLRSTQAQDAIAGRIADWYSSGPADVGILTGQVLRTAGHQPSGRVLAGAAVSIHERTGRSAGNGSLMRTSAVALAHLHDPPALVEAAVAVSALTHADPRAGEACALWCLAIRHSVLRGSFDVRAGLERLPGESQGFWRDRLDEAEQEQPSSFSPNGYVVTALQAAWSAIHHTMQGDRDFPCTHVLDGLETAIRVGDDTDTVASIAGALLGGRWGASAFPARWRSMVHGWPGVMAGDLADLALLATNGGRADGRGWPGCASIDYSGWVGHDSFAIHPEDPGVYLSGASALANLPTDVTAVVSLCRLGREDVPGHVRHVDFRLLDTCAADNPNLEYVIDDAARTVARLRDEGEVVLLHCVAARSRTPVVAARYAVLRGVPQTAALSGICAALPGASVNADLAAALGRLEDLQSARR